MVESSWYGLLQIFGALALFIYGMKVISEGVQRIASIQMRDALRSVTQNKTSSFLAGFFTTALIQSSSAMTVMVVSFVNAGILPLTAAAGIIIGSNAGTTVTVWLVTMLGFEFNLFTICLPLIALAMPFLFIKNGKYRHWAETVIGFSLLLIAIQFLKSVVPELQRQPEMFAFISAWGDEGIISILLFVGFGIVFTALIQSSSAAMALTLTMCFNGWLSFDIAAAMVLGENIGTTITAEIASWVGNTESKKAARFHVLFNVLGVIVFLPFLPVLLPFVAWVADTWLDLGDPYTETRAMPVALAVFYTLFNLVCAVVFLAIIPLGIRLASRTIRAADDAAQKIHFIDTGTHTADLSLPVAIQEIVQQCQRVKNLNSILNRIINIATEAEYHEQLTLASEYLQQLHARQQAINHYLVGMVEDKSSLITSRQIKSLLNTNLMIGHISSNYEKIFQMLTEKRQQRIWFGPTQRSMLLHRINEASVILKEVVRLLPAGDTRKLSWKSLAIDSRERAQDYNEFEKELVSELERGEMKLPSVVIYYRIAQRLDSTNEALERILAEFMEETL